jgi:hypothetical protein
MQAPRHQRVKGAALLVAIVVAAVAASAVASASLSQPAPVPAEERLQRDIDNMIAAGLDPDDPKVEMVRRDLEALQAGRTATTSADMNRRAGNVIADARAADADAGDARAAAGGAPAWDSGPVECEVVPGLLTAPEVAGATCVSVPQPDGTSRYLAIAADGAVRAVLFGPDGHVTRLPDFHLPAAPAAGASFAPTPEGDLQATNPGQPPTVADVR